jgi:hypothetical protein
VRMPPDAEPMRRPLRHSTARRWACTFPSSYFALKNES